MRKIKRIWADLKEAGCPDLSDDMEMEFRLALLNFYIMPCVEEFIASKGSLTPSTIVHLHNCKRDLAYLLKKSDGAIPCYFEQLLMLTREVMHRVKVKEACLIVAREAECEIGLFFSSPNDFFSFNSEY